MSTDSSQLTPGVHTGPAGTSIIKKSYHPRLTNEDLAPLVEQKWNWYNIFAFWMADVHSVGGYVTAGALFALGLTSWQVFVCLIVGICIVQAMCNLVAKPSQVHGLAYPVVARVAFGVLGANIAAIIRGSIAIAWYGVQTFLAAGALTIVILKLFPGLGDYATDAHSFLGLSYIGYLSFAILWVLQALVFWKGMEMVRWLCDVSGPLIYAMMFILCIYMMARADWQISLDLTMNDLQLSVGQQLAAMAGAIALVVSYFAGPMLNFGDFSRYAKSYKQLKRGNFIGLPINFVVFSLLVVLTASATLPVFGELMTNPIDTVEAIDTYFAVLMGGFAFVLATIGINIVANFVAPAFDFSNVNPQKISWRTGGMIAACGSVILMPWNWYNNDEAILWTLGILGALIGPLFGILIADYYLIRKQHVVVDDLFSMEEGGTYWYQKGFNPVAVKAVIVGGAASISSVVLPEFVSAVSWLGQYSWFVGCIAAFLAYVLFARNAGMHLAAAEEMANAKATSDIEVSADGSVAPSDATEVTTARPTE